jgi:glycerate dehydrogenase
MKEKIVIIDAQFHNPGDLSWEYFRELGDLQVYNHNKTSEVPKLIRDATVVLSTVTTFTRELLLAAKKLKYLGTLTIGYDLVDIQAAKDLGITVTNVPGFCSIPVSQHALALLLEICNHVGFYDSEVKAGNWVEVRPKCYFEYPIIELDGSTMGVIGLGRIGLAVAKGAVGLGMKVLADEKHRNPNSGQMVEYQSLSQVLAQSDVLVLACPLTPETLGLINSISLQGMKDGVIIINVGRGKLIDEAALALALNSGKVRAAGLDVVSVEPITSDNPLRTAKNLFLTPHLAGTSKEARQRLVNLGWENLQLFLQGVPINVVS